MSNDSIGAIFGKLAGAAIRKEGCSKVMPVRKPVRMYSKPNKKPMPQPAYTKQASKFLQLLAAGAFENPPAAEEPRRPVAKRQAPVKRKLPARGPVTGTMPVRRRPRRSINRASR